jgi:hypothetical protein
VRTASDGRVVDPNITQATPYEMALSDMTPIEGVRDAEAPRISSSKGDPSSTWHEVFHRLALYMISRF